MTVTAQIKILDRKIMQLELRQKYYAIMQLKIWVLSQALLNKLNLSILHWVKIFNKGLDKDED